MFWGRSPIVCLSVHLIQGQWNFIQSTVHVTVLEDHPTSPRTYKEIIFMSSVRDSSACSIFIYIFFAFCQSHTEMQRTALPKHCCVSSNDGCFCPGCTEAVFVHALHRVSFSLYNAHYECLLVGLARCHICPSSEASRWSQSAMKKCFVIILYIYI